MRLPLVVLVAGGRVAWDIGARSRRRDARPPRRARRGGDVHASGVGGAAGPCALGARHSAKLVVVVVGGGRSVHARRCVPHG